MLTSRPHFAPEMGRISCIFCSVFSPKFGFELARTGNWKQNVFFRFGECIVKARAVLREDHLISFINELYDGDLHAKRVLSLAHGTLGVLTSASLAVHAIGQGLAHARGTLSKHGVKQVDRLLSNRTIELEDFFSHWVPHVIGAREEIVVALDWTSFARDGHDTLMLSMLTEHGRATGVMWETVSTATLKDNRNRYEDELLYRFWKVVPEGVKVTVVADRGFADCNLFKYLEEDLGFGYVIRLPGSSYVTSESGERRLASQWVRPTGRIRTLRGAQVTDAHLLTVGTVVCLRDKDMKDSWCLVASDPNAAPRVLIHFYAKRWGIETSFRDLKDPRYGPWLVVDAGLTPRAPRPTDVDQRIGHCVVVIARGRRGAYRL